MNNMETKVIEVRDEGTFILVLAIRMDAAPNDIVRNWAIHYRSGYPRDGSAIVVMRLSDQKATVDPYDWGNRTMGTAHDFIYNNFDSLKDGDVVDVQVILGETEAPKISERITEGLYVLAGETAHG